MGDPEDDAVLPVVGLFPLPNLVLFPRAVLPLHIFEERYKTMMADALDGDRCIAMALLKPGWEKNYHGRAAIEPIVCVGRILTHERLADGKYNLLLQGRQRARIVREVTAQPYRRASLAPLRDTAVMEIDVEPERRRLTEIFTHGGMSSIPVAEQFRKLLAGPLPTADLSDLLAFNFIDDVDLKQSLLAETDARRRVELTVSALARLTPVRTGAWGLLADPNLN